METNQELSQPPHLKRWLQETSKFLEVCSQDSSLINSLVAERDQLSEAFKTLQEKHKEQQKIACHKLQERVQKLGADFEEKVKKMTKEKEHLAKVQEEELTKVRSEMQAEIHAMREQLQVSKSENWELRSKFKTMEETVKKCKELFQKVIQFSPTCPKNL